MKKTVYVLLFLNILVNGQEISENTFSQSEKGNNSEYVKGKDSDLQKKPGNPAPRSPIDQYEGLLLLFGLGLIATFSRKIRRQKLDKL